MNNRKASTPSRDAVAATPAPKHRRSRSGVAVLSTTETNVAALLPRVDVPTDADVLCSQSGDYINHPGNRFFRRVVDDFADRYEHASGRQKK